MANKAGKMGGAKGTVRKRYLKGTETLCRRIMYVDGGKKRFVWGVEADKGYRHVNVNETELR